MERAAETPIIETPPVLPRGPHGLTREEVAASQRLRLMAAFTELMAADGYAAVTIGDLAARASVSRGAFYEHFRNKEACLLAAYGHFAATLLGAMTAAVVDGMHWSDFIDVTLRGYLGTLEGDPVAARAFLIEMDAAGPAARRRRSEGMHAFAAVFAERHAAARARDPELGPLPERAYLGLVLGVRELVREALEQEPAPELTRLLPDLVTWISATVEGAAAANA
jgi:AcrR family transcriptional regulator